MNLQCGSRKQEIELENRDEVILVSLHFQLLSNQYFCLLPSVPHRAQEACVR